MRRDYRAYLEDIVEAAEVAVNHRLPQCRRALLALHRVTRPL